MFELFIALFGGSYIYGKTRLEKSRRNDISKRWNAYRSIVLKTTNIEMEKRILSNIKSSKIHRIKMIDSVKDELVYILGSDYLSFFKYHIANYTSSRDIESNNEYWVSKNDFDINTLYGFGNVWYLAFNILMSKFGYIPSAVNEYDINYIIIGIDKDMSKMIACKALEIIEENVKTSHQNLDICLCKNGDKYTWNHWMNIYT